MASLSQPALSDPRKDFFRQLKPVCVALGQITIRTQQSPDTKETLRLVESVTSLWTGQASRDATILDEKLAEYVFFPLSHLLRSQEKYPIRVIEATIKLISSLIQYGWKAKLSQELAHQLLIFFSLILSGSAPGESKQREIPEETIIQGYRAINTLITATGSTTLVPAASAATQEDEVIPALGHSVTVVLDGITAGIPPLIQLEALQCLNAVYTAIRNNAVLARFLPGTVSTLSRLLSPPSNQKTQRRVLIRCLEVLKLVLVTVLGDLKIRCLLHKIKDAKPSQDDQTTETKDEGTNKELSPAWLKATTAQVKIALSSVLKLRSHESEQVQAALDSLCITLLDECHASLADCQSILVETAMMVEDEEAEKSLLQTSLQDLAAIYPELGDIIKSTLYSWITGLPRQIQSNDDRVKKLAVRSILRGTKLAAALHMDSSTLDDSLGNSLRDCVVSLIRDSKPSKVLDDIDSEGGLSPNQANTELIPYRPVLLDHEGQKTTRAEISTLISKIGSPEQQVKLATAMLSSLRDSEGVDQIASFWLSFELLKATYNQTSELDELFDLSSLDETKDQEGVFRELYEFSASIISSHSDTDEQDWRLEAIALEVTAFAASRLKEDFKPELIDVLYPVTTCLGSTVPQLRRHAIATLNRLASSCGYASVSDLIIDNVDYMVNSISLRLNTFDISPASTKVLTMMIRLTGPKIIPYLDDVVAAIFAALDNYHGYPIFVESLFAVLSEMVNQGARSEASHLLLEDSSAGAKSIDHRKRKLPSRGIEGILEMLEQRAQKAKKLKLEEEEQTDEVDKPSHPKRPWGPEKSQAKSLLDKLESGMSLDEEDDEKTAAAEGEEESTAVAEKDKEKQPQPTYTLLGRILTLTQHYLTSPTPTLRKSLLELVGTLSPALAPDENAFLPMVNSLWPVVISRLYDGEVFVVIAACHALAGLCKSAGDFLGTRFKTEWWSSSVSFDSKIGGGGGGRGTKKSGGNAGGLGKWLRGVKAEAIKARGKIKTKRDGPSSLGSSRGGLLSSSSSVSGVGDGIILPSRSTGDNITVGSSGKQSGQEQLTESLMSLSVTTHKSFPSQASSAIVSGPGSGSSGALGRFSQASQLWDAAVRLVTAIVMYVRIDDDMFDEILELVVDELAENGELKGALEAVNADAVWLALYERGGLKAVGGQLEAPASVPGFGFEFVQLEAGVVC
ncbi:Armadillo-type fold [Naviculisporaceae sp. PSN 640]